MEFYQPNPEQAPLGLQAMTMVAKAAEGGLAQPQRALLTAAQQVVLHTDLDVDQLATITPTELAQQFTEPGLARQLIQGMVVMSLANGPASEAQSELITQFANALAVEEPAVKVIHHLAEQDLVLFRLDFYRRSHFFDYARTQYRTQGGFLGVVKGVLGVKGLVEDPALAAQFRALESLPSETLGVHFYHHYADHGFSFPGEKGGFPYGAVWHDFGHILGGYDTSPEGEILAAAFQSGFRRNENAFFTVLFALLIHTAGINVAPIEMPKLLGRIGQGDLAKQMIMALKRGVTMTVDLGADWDFWAYVELPLEEARQVLGVPEARSH